MEYNSYTDNLRISVFDIETTGLRSENDMVISASFCDEDGKSLRQYFCDDPGSEYLLLTKIFDELNSLDAVITFNGERFDIPFVAARAKKYGLDYSLKYLWNIDILKILKAYWEAGKLLPNLKQKSVEHALGLDLSRSDEIDGGECISLYNNYLLNHSEAIKEKILLHNGDDVRQLAKISEKLSFIPFHRVAYEKGWLCKTRPGYPGADDVRIIIGPVNERSDSFIINGHVSSGMSSLSVFEEYFNLQYDRYSGSARLEIKPKELENYIYVDLTAFPIDISLFKSFEGFSSNYLILKQGDKLYYREINALIRELFMKII